MTTYVTIKDILESAKKHGNDAVLTWDPAVFRDNKKNNKNTKFDCTWIPFKFKFVNGNEVPLRVKFSKVLTASGAKLPSIEGETLKNMIIVFKTLTMEEIMIGDYAPKKMDSSAEQIIEDKKMNDSALLMQTATNEFNTAMEIIDKSYQNVCQQMKNAQSLGFTLRKDKKVKTNEDINVYSIRQCTREDKENPGSEDIKLKFPLTRLKLMLGKDGQVGVENWNSTSKSFDFSANVYDSRKMSVKNNYTPVLAAVKENNKSCALNSKNAGVFITYRSVVGGILEFQEIVVSKFGLSLANKFKELYVKRNKSTLTESAFSKEDFESMVDNDNDESEDDVQMPTIEEKFTKVKISAVEQVSDLEDNESGSDLEDDCEE
jgi:hypothetical protein